MKNLKMRLYIVVMFVVLYAGRCNKPLLGERFYTITVYNNSSDTIYPYFASGSPFTQYPDTALPADKPALSRILPQSSMNNYSRDDWEKIIGDLAADTLSIFILDDDVYRDSAWGVVRDKYLILKRYDLSVNDLKTMGWKVQFP